MHIGERVELRGKDESRKGAPTNGLLFKVSSVKGTEGTCSPPTSGRLEEQSAFVSSASADRMEIKPA